LARTDVAVISPPKSEMECTSAEALEVAAEPTSVVAEVESEPVVATEPSEGKAKLPPNDTR
jgi:hypothetical protein